MKLPYATAALAGVSTVYATSASAQPTGQRKRSLGTINNASTKVTANRTNFTTAQGRPAVQLKRSNSTIPTAGLPERKPNSSTASAGTPLYVSVTRTLPSSRREKRQGRFAEREAAGTGCFIHEDACPGTMSYDTCKGECKPEEPGKQAPSPNQTHCRKGLSTGAIVGIAVGSAVGGGLMTGAAVGISILGNVASAFSRR